MTATEEEEGPPESILDNAALLIWLQVYCPLHLYRWAASTRTRMVITLESLKRRPSLALPPPHPPPPVVDTPASAAPARRTSSDANSLPSSPADPAPITESSKAGADPGARWLINVDIDGCVQRGDLKTLHAADREMRILAREYHVQKREQDIMLRDQATVVAWLNLLEAVGAFCAPRRDGASSHGLNPSLVRL